MITCGSRRRRLGPRLPSVNNPALGLSQWPGKEVTVSFSVAVTSFTVTGDLLADTLINQEYITFAGPSYFIALLLQGDTYEGAWRFVNFSVDPVTLRTISLDGFPGGVSSTASSTAWEGRLNRGWADSPACIPAAFPSRRPIATWWPSRVRRRSAI